MTFRVAVTGPNGITIGADWLGNSIYADVASFRREHIGARGRWGSYFRDMVRTSIAEARSELARIKALPLRAAA